MVLDTRSVLQVRRVRAKDRGQQPISRGSDLEQSPLPSPLTCITLVCTQLQNETHSLSIVILRTLHLQHKPQTGRALSQSESVCFQPKPLKLASFYPPLKLLTNNSYRHISLSTPSPDCKAVVMTLQMRQRGSKWCYCSPTIALTIRQLMFTCKDCCQIQIDSFWLQIWKCVYAL